MNDTLLLITRNGMGAADEALQLKLLDTYLKLLLQNELTPGVIACYTEGVRVAVEGSPLLGPLTALVARGTHVILCRTCLERFGLLEQVRVGIVGGMGDIQAAQVTARKVITL